MPAIRIATPANYKVPFSFSHTLKRLKAQQRERDDEKIYDRKKNTPMRKTMKAGRCKCKCKKCKSRR